MFPGTRPGAHLESARLVELLNEKIGIFTRPARGGALCALAGDLPAPILADLLGLGVSTATRWGALAGREHAVYLAARAANPSPTATRSSTGDQHNSVGPHPYPLR
ncbi:hypothetical protein [Rhodococcus jostii]|uniref:hypothetical protein n=1 Tax=Rhodococcus jostii TaxID=132919 RepID=UPI0036674BF3